VSEHASEHKSASNQTSTLSKTNEAELESAAVVDTRRLTPATVLQLQRTMGNRAVQAMIQRAGGTGSTGGTPAPSAAPAPTAAELRRTALDAERDLKVAEQAELIFNEVKAELTQSLKSYMKASDTSEIRKRVQLKIAQGIAAAMDSSGLGTTNQKADAKKHALMSAEALMMSNLESYAETMTTANFLETIKDQLKVEGNKVYDNLTPSLNDAAFEKQKNKAFSDSKKTMKEKALTSKTSALTTSKSTITENFKTAGPGMSSLRLGTVVVDELTKRIDKENLLVDQAADVVSTVKVAGVGGAPDRTRNVMDMETIYNSVLHGPMKKAVSLKLGTGRGRFTSESKALKEFRNILKEGAKAQVKDDINQTIGGNADFSRSGPMAKEYYKMLANSKAAGEAEVKVDDVVLEKAESIVEATIPRDEVTKKLADAGKSAAYEVAIKTPNEKKKIRAAGTAAAKAFAEKTFKTEKPNAIKAARKITKGDKSTTPGAAEVRSDPAPLVTAVKEKVKAKNADGKSIGDLAAMSVEAKSLQSGFTKVGKLIDFSTPNEGDSSKFEIELKIPIASAAGGGEAYFLFGFGGEAERETGELTVNTEITFGAGFSTFGLDANFRFGLFLEGKGKDTNSVMNLLSYGLYREMLYVSKSAAGFFWGQGGKSGDSKQVEAEKWAMMVEEQDLGDDAASIDVGTLTKLAAEANVGVAQFSGELARKALTRYTKSIIAEKAGTSVTAAERVAFAANPANAGKRFRRGKGIGNGEGQVRKIIEAATEYEVGLGSDKVAFGLEGAFTWVDGKFEEVEIDASGTIPSKFGEESGAFTEYIAKIASAVAGGGKNLAGIAKRATDSEGDKKKRGAGALLDTGTDALFTGNYFDDIGTSLSTKLKGDETVNDTMRGWFNGGESNASEITESNNIGLSNSLKLALKLHKVVPWDTGDWDVTLEASQVKSLEVDAEIVKVAVEKSKRLGKIGYSRANDTKGYQGELFGRERASARTPVQAPSGAAPTRSTQTGSAGAAPTSAVTATGTQSGSVPAGGTPVNTVPSSATPAGPTSATPATVTPTP
jgi:hypothetical protein